MIAGVGAVTSPDALPCVIVLVQSSLEVLDGCLAALDRTLPAGAAVLIAQTAECDPRQHRLLTDWRTRSALAVREVHGGESDGWLDIANQALSAAGDDDVLLLSSAIALTPASWQPLLRCAASDTGIASITPWSNAAQICGFPRFCDDNPAPVDADLIAEAAAALSAPSYPDLPGGVGDCWYLRRSGLRQVGDFDSRSFASAAGGEADWCLRASAMGWRHVLCDSAFVVYQQDRLSAPIPPDVDDGLSLLSARWPKYQETYARFLMADPLRPLRERMLATIDSLRDGGPQRDLFGALS